MAVAEVTVKLAFTPLNVTAVAPVKFVPLIVTLVPTGPLVGVKLVIVGALTTVNALGLVAVPWGVVTLNVPVVAPVGTIVQIAASEITEKLAAIPLKLAAVAAVKLAPLIVTPVPTAPLVGVKLVIVGGLTSMNSRTLVAVPAGGPAVYGP